MKSGLIRSQAIVAGWQRRHDVKASGIAERTEFRFTVQIDNCNGDVDNTAPLASVTIPEIEAVAVCPMADKPETRNAVINAMQRGILIPLSFGKKPSDSRLLHRRIGASIHLVFRNKNAMLSRFCETEPVRAGTGQ